MSRPRFTVTACVLVRRGDRWLLSVRSPTVEYAPGAIGLIGGHVESDEATADVLETTARREVVEETGLDLTDVALRYLSSDLFLAGDHDQQVTVTFVADAPAGAEPAVRSDELTALDWWSLAELRLDPRTPDWLPALIERAATATP